MILLDAQPPNPDTLFWYTIAAGLTTLLFGLLIWLISRYLSENKNILAGITETLNRLVTNDAVKEGRLNRVEEDIENIKDKIYPITYKGKRG